MASTSPHTSLDAEIASLQEELASLRRTIKIECSTILSSASFQSRRSKHRLPSSSSSPSSSSKHPKSKHKPSASSSASSTPPSPSSHKPTTTTTTASSSSSSSSSSFHAPPFPGIAPAAALHAAHAQQSTYRIAASITAFHVRDPDPAAVDAARVLGLRFEAMARGRFLKPYYVLLNRPFHGSKRLRVHRHTVPPAVPLAGLARRFLPGPDPISSGSNSGSSDARGPPQDLHAFATRLRRDIVRYHNRLGASADLRHALADAPSARDEHEPAAAGVDVGIADVEAKHISLSWPVADRSARIVIDDDGDLLAAAVFGPHGRDWLAARRLLGDAERPHVHDIIKLIGEE